MAEPTNEPSYTYLPVSEGAPVLVDEWCVCDRCGAMVGDRPLHDLWHDSLAGEQRG